MITNSSIHCSQCGQAIAPGLKGLCPNCLAIIGFSARPASADAVLQESLPKTDGAPRLPLSSGLHYFGDYEILSEVARGGMGVVYRARQVSLNRVVAVKMIRGAQFASEADVRRFRAEAEAAANLQHPNIVAIHETGEHEGLHYFSMELVEGINLAQALEETPFSPVQAATLLETIAEAIHYAHQRGTLHRDLKPSNILLDSSGRPRITDFGIAKQLSCDSGLTQAGSVMGSPSYMPPEQADGKWGEIGPASDVYALGAILYQMLTGQPPFSGKTPLETLRLTIETEPIPPSKHNPLTPPDLEIICLKCLEKKPLRRFHSARELADELHRFLRREPIFAEPASHWRKAWSWSQRNPWAFIGILAALGVILLGIAHGLWERVQYLEWKNSPHGPDKTKGQYFVGLRDPAVIQIIGLALAIPATFLARWIKRLEMRNLLPSLFHLTALAFFGLSLVMVGIYADMLQIQIYVWMNVFGILSTVGLCLGLPLLYSWLGGALLWQAIGRHNGRSSGSFVPAKEWIPLRPSAYSATTFVFVNLLNLLLFAFLAWLAMRFGPFDNFFRFSGKNPESSVLFFTGFIFISLAVSFGCWIYATREVNPRPWLATVLLCCLYGGSAVVWFSFLPPAFPLLAGLSGLGGGLLLVKITKIKKVNAPSKELILSP